MTSLIPVEKSIIKTACNNAIASVLKNRKRLFEMEVELLMKPRWWRKGKTRENAIEILQRPVSSLEESFAPWRCQGWGTEGKAERLLQSIEVCNGDIAYPSTEDATFVNNYKEI